MASADGPTPPGSSPGLLGSRLPLPVVLALRYLRSTRRDAFATFLSAVAAGGIGLGVAALIFALAWLSGLQSALRREVLERTPEIEVRPPPGADPREVLQAALAVPGVEEARLVVRGQGWLVAGGQAEGVLIVGFDGPLPPTFPGAAGSTPGLYVGLERATAWDLEPGDLLSVVSPRPTLTPLGPQPRIRSLPLAGIFESSATEDVERVALPREVAETLLGDSDRRLDVRAGGLEAALAVAPRLARALPEGSEVRTWRELNRALLFALDLEKLLTFVALSLVVVVAGLALVVDLALLISKKRREIGMLQALGATAGTVRATFLLLGAMVTGIGMAGGAAVGVSAAWLFDRFRLVPVPGRVYFIDHVPFVVQAGDVAGVLALAVVLAAASAGYAAHRATALVPVQELRR